MPLVQNASVFVPEQPKAIHRKQTTDPNNKKRNTVITVGIDQKPKIGRVHIYYAEIFVIAKVTNALFGFDFLTNCKLIIDYKNKTILNPVTCNKIKPLQTEITTVTILNNNVEVP